MTTGAIIFAQNNSKIDYTKLAVFAATRLKHHLDIPVSLITDNPKWVESSYPQHPFDQIIPIPLVKATQTKKFYDGSLSSSSLDWKNLARGQVYNLTPYDRTLVIDSDYIINSNVLKLALENDHDFQIYQNSFDLAWERQLPEFTRINQYSIPFYWATVFVFKKTLMVESFFDLITYIKANWNYFKMLYHINSPTFRNDFAFSIAIHIMNGKTKGDFAVELPGKMIYATDNDVLLNAKDDNMSFLTQKKNYLGEYLATKTQGLDVHVMNKHSLLRYIDGGTGV